MTTLHIYQKRRVKWNKQQTKFNWLVRSKSTRCFKLLATVSRNVDFRKPFLAAGNNSGPKVTLEALPSRFVAFNVTYRVSFSDVLSKDCKYRANVVMLFRFLLLDIFARLNISYGDIQLQYQIFHSVMLFSLNQLSHSIIFLPRNIIHLALRFKKCKYYLEIFVIITTVPTYFNLYYVIHVKLIQIYFWNLF